MPQKHKAFDVLFFWKIKQKYFYCLFIYMMKRTISIILFLIFLSSCGYDYDESLPILLKGEMNQEVCVLFFNTNQSCKTYRAFFMGYDTTNSNRLILDTFETRKSQLLNLYLTKHRSKPYKNYVFVNIITNENRIGDIVTIDGENHILVAVGNNTKYGQRIGKGWFSLYVDPSLEGRIPLRRIINKLLSKESDGVLPFIANNHRYKRIWEDNDVTIVFKVADPNYPLAGYTANEYSSNATNLFVYVYIEEPIPDEEIIYRTFMRILVHEIEHLFFWSTYNCSQDTFAYFVCEVKAYSLSREYIIANNLYLPKRGAPIKQNMSIQDDYIEECLIQLMTSSFGEYYPSCFRTPGFELTLYNYIKTNLVIYENLKDPDAYVSWRYVFPQIFGKDPVSFWREYYIQTYFTYHDDPTIRRIQENYRKYRIPDYPGTNSYTLGAFEYRAYGFLPKDPFNPVTIYINKDTQVEKRILSSNKVLYIIY